MLSFPVPSPFSVSLSPFLPHARGTKRRTGNTVVFTRPRRTVGAVRALRNGRGENNAVEDALVTNVGVTAQALDASMALLIKVRSFATESGFKGRPW